MRRHTLAAALAACGVVLARPASAGAQGTPAAPAAPAAPVADATRAGPLFDALARLDAALFDASFVRCDTAAVFALLADDVEFYHDQTGLHRGAEVRADFARLAARCPRAGGVRRELVPGTLRVYPVRDFGAVQTGEHRFLSADGAPPLRARFVHVWQQEGATWRVRRVLSLDHRPER